MAAENLPISAVEGCALGAGERAYWYTREPAASFGNDSFAAGKTFRFFIGLSFFTR